MPLYEYHCNSCKEVFEKVVRFSETDLVQHCPKCESADTEKLLSAPALFNTSPLGNTSKFDSSCGSAGGFT